jgi:hypothetical protein
MDKQIYFKSLIANPNHNPEDKNSHPFKWHHELANRNLQVGDVVEFLCNGRGRGGHHRVFARVTKVNRKTFKATELPRSYNPGTLWTVHFEADPDNYSSLIIDLSWKE